MDGFIQGAEAMCPINAKMEDRKLKPFKKLDQDQSGWDTKLDYCL